ncbi:uncharacterized protein LOC108324575 [Vigna angularis]|uniref:uncharacterized protein LOC108324575 n=1 Tax=Phaseolus angularis TaxID=3914 RepID=UPI000809F3E8|nr:uncharacterized protein LOC108324575 [Vigna angularis]
MIFAKPKGLPPNRSQNHCIPLLLDVNAVRVKPYKYPHSQKQQIENVVQQMLEDEIITHNTSPFSSPIILVKKKDDTWRFCTDYRALNVVTIKDIFPIPTVEELLDELFGAKFFSKMDLRSGYQQILVHPTDKFKTAFRTHQGHWKDNQEADALSRSFFMAWSHRETNLMSKIHKATQLDPNLQSVIQACAVGKLPNINYSYYDGFLHWKHRVMIPRDAEIIQLLLKEYHSSTLGGHVGITRTMARLSSQFYWSGMLKDLLSMSKNSLYANKLNLPPLYQQGYYNHCQCRIRLGKI